jgi:hypothetical protein
MASSCGYDVDGEVQVSPSTWENHTGERDTIHIACGRKLQTGRRHLMLISYWGARGLQKPNLVFSFIG